ncbi:AAA family ATPase [Mariniflexile gromovii]|uniref:AAA family ATPase n=1 Tax=Mariniflexile gromovii TaxID=362523 RepID=A0ABS4BNV9_9FLAO|nr:AAA family ATPase [Mariniflexile gromovii]MBP0902212.1 AAA family ATPase [Mariniflexile gromovii]
MKITNLKIEGYKNLEAKLVASADIIALIGNNGSGKSNLLEAISYIFRSLYRSNENVSFDYLIEYTNSNNQKIKIEKNRSKVTSFVDGVATINIKEYLPKKVIAIYSGEEDRLWNKCFFPFYDDYVKNINKSSNTGILKATSLMPQMLYLNKFYWHLSLLSLLLSDLDDNKAFVENVLNITQVDKISISFNKSNYTQYNEGLVLDFIKKIDKKSEYTLQEFKQLIEGEGYIPDDVYKLLYIAFSPKNTKIITDIIIRFNQHLTIEDLSEGEKKLLLIKAAFEFAEQEDSLFILDEPDAHIHLNNKEQIVKTFEPYKNNRQIVITTHSPTVTKAMNDDCLFMVNEGKIISKEKQEIIDDLAGDFWNKHQQSTFLSSNKNLILLVEGEHDKIHIKNALNKLKPKFKDLDFDIFSFGSESKIQPFMLGLFEANLNNNKTYVAIYDNDSPGQNSLGKFQNEENQNGFRKGLKVEPEKQQWNNNFYAITLPKPSGHSADCTIENMYESVKFEEAFEKAFQDKKGFFSNLSIEKIGSDLKKSAKNILAQNCVSFEISDLKHFEPLFDTIQKIKLDMLSTQTAKVAKEMVTKKVNKKPNLKELVPLTIVRKKYTEEDHFKKGTPRTIKIYKELKAAISKLDANIKIQPLKDYIAFKKNTNILDISIQTKQIKMWINLKKGKLKDQKALTRDVSEIGHWGNGDYELTIKDNSNFEYIISLIEQAVE